MLTIALASLGFLVTLGIAEGLKAFLCFSGDITRKIAHMISGVYCFYLLETLSRSELIVLSLIFVAILSTTKILRLFKSIHGVSRSTWGEIYFPLSLGLLAIFFLPGHIYSAQFGILVLGFSDALASIFGVQYGFHSIRVFNHKKSVEGSVVFFIATCAIIYFFLPFAPISAYGVFILAALVLTVTELVLTQGLDNLFLPLVGACLFQYILLALAPSL